MRFDHAIFARIKLLPKIALGRFTNLTCAFPAGSGKSGVAATSISAGLVPTLASQRRAIVCAQFALVVVGTVESVAGEALFALARHTSYCIRTVCIFGTRIVLCFALVHV